MGSGGSDESSAYAREQWLARREARLLDLEEVLRRGGTESLRTRWAEELRWVHADFLDQGQREEAAQLQRKIAAELQREPGGTCAGRELVWRQHLAWARVCLDAVRSRVDEGEDQAARGRLPELLERAHAVAGRADGALVLAEALEVAHGIECRLDRLSVARVHLRRLGERAERSSDPRVAEPLARALRCAARADAAQRNVDRVRAHVAQLRALAARATAGRIEGIALSYALESLHEHVDRIECVDIEHELAGLATRPGADHEQHRVWIAVAGRAERRGRRVLRPSLEMLRQRAYRGSGVDDVSALFRRLEDELPLQQRIFHEHIAVLNELRCLAERPEADPSLRLRFARHWVPTGFDARRYDYGAVANDRCAHAWSAEAAQRGDLEGQVLLGRCLARGRGVPRDRTAAAELLRQAAGRGSDEAQMLLRSLGVERFPWLRHRFVVHMCVGFGMLALHLFTQPFELNGWGVLAYLGVIFGVMWVRRVLLRVAALVRDADVGDAHEDASTHARDYVFRLQVSRFGRKPWRILRVIYEDGAAVAPLAWLGISPLTALGAGLVFGLAHYPQYRLRLCLTLAVVYFAVVLLVLPWAGLWAVATGHVVYDVIVLCQGLSWRRKVDESADE